MSIALALEMNKLWNRICPSPTNGGVAFLVLYYLEFRYHSLEIMFRHTYAIITIIVFCIEQYYLPYYNNENTFAKFRNKQANPNFAQALENHPNYFGDPPFRTMKKETVILGFVLVPLIASFITFNIHIRLLGYVVYVCVCVCVCVCVHFFLRVLFLFLFFFLNSIAILRKKQLFFFFVSRKNKQTKKGSTLLSFYIWVSYIINRPDLIVPFENDRQMKTSKGLHPWYYPSYISFSLSTSVSLAIPFVYGIQMLFIYHSQRMFFFSIHIFHNSSTKI